jgi:hypothetical protein
MAGGYDDDITIVCINHLPDRGNQLKGTVPFKNTRPKKIRRHKCRRDIGLRDNSHYKILNATTHIIGPAPNNMATNTDKKTTTNVNFFVSSSNESLLSIYFSFSSHLLSASSLNNFKSTPDALEET